jgi:NADH-quinone oxidoreductase subunit H
MLSIRELLTTVITSLVINIIYFVLLDRLMMAAVQRRTGPYNVGLFGLLQSMDDGLKLVKKEVIIPKKSSCTLFLVIPNLFFYFSLIL